MVAHWEKNIVQKKYSSDQRSLSKLLGCWVKDWANETLEEYSILQEQPLSSGHSSLSTNKKGKDILCTPFQLWTENLLKQNRCKRWVSEGRGRKRLIIVEIQDSSLFVLCPQLPSIKFHINKIIQLLSMSYHSWS